jgi:hypothetical protein
MKIRIEKKSARQYLILLGSETEVNGFFLTPEDLAKLKTNVTEAVEFPDRQAVGDVI